MGNKEEFIEKIGKSATDLYEKYRILPSLTVAQACLESNFGRCRLSPYFNFFGMKWTPTCGTDKVEFWTNEQNADGSYRRIKASFRAFSSYEDGIEGYYKFLTGYKRYKNLIGVTDFRTACRLIREDGWATSLRYSASLIKYIQTYNLTRFDKMVLKDIPVEEKEESKNITYTVQKGDCLWSISKRFLGNGNRYREILKLNHLQSSVIFPGQTLIIKKEGE